MSGQCLHYKLDTICCRLKSEDSGEEDSDKNNKMKDKENEPQASFTNELCGQIVHRIVTITVTL